MGKRYDSEVYMVINKALKEQTAGGTADSYHMSSGTVHKILKNTVCQTQVNCTDKDGEQLHFVWRSHKVVANNWHAFKYNPPLFLW